ncbi:MAG: prepilin-type N-terminal cleavage/methylation domain-containing protein, partial [Candidatus Gracilibacteria bacterium]|nr:prepilin-type N-terminal cleavage/methylation domain-containing protein [Candidatus Gracilibacteria bacterium]
MNKKAFTLVELIVVITILAILGTIAFMALQGYSTSARDSTRLSDLSSMKTSLELFELDAGKYPQASSGVNITYSGATVWNQGTFGETVFANVDRLDKIPTDPLTEKEYTYSTLLTGNEYELGGMMEGEIISFRPPLTPPYQGGEQATVASSPLIRDQSIAGRVELIRVSAGDTEATAYTTGNYNGQMTKSLSGNTCNVLSLPTIITNDTSVTDLEQIVTEQKLVYTGYRNLPSTFKTSKFKYDGGFDFTTTKLVAYSDTGACAPLTSTTSNTARLTLLQGLQQAYSGTIVQDKGEIKNIVSLNIDINNPSPELVNYSNNYVNNTLGGNLATTGGGGGTTTTYNNCTATTQSGYTIPQISHGINNQLVTKTISNGTQ